MSLAGECPCGEVSHATHFYACGEATCQSPGALAQHPAEAHKQGSTGRATGESGQGGVSRSTAAGGYLWMGWTPNESPRR